MRKKLSNQRIAGNKSMNFNIEGKISKIKSTGKVCNRNSYYLNKRKKPIKETAILFESKAGADLAGNIFYLLKELTKKEYSKFQCYLNVNLSNKDRVKKLLWKYQINNVILLEMNSKKYLEMLATAKYIVNDTSFPTWFYKRPEQVYLNTWHGTPLKHMGYEVENRAFAMGNIQKNFQIADYLLYPNDYMKEKMIHAYYLENTYQGKILCEGYPRNAIFYQKERTEIIRKELELTDKQVIVCMPTWRGTLTESANTEQVEACACNFAILDKLLNDNQVFYVKFHVFLQGRFDFSEYKHIKPFPEGYETYDFLNSADILVTDYSSVFFDFANTRKKIVLFTYDRKDYLDERGLYIPLDSLPFPQAENVTELCEEFNLPKTYDDKEFLEKFCTYDNIDAANKIAKHVFLGQKVCKEEKAKGNGKPNILVYCSNLAMNGITTSLLNLMSLVDKEKANYYFFFKQNQFTKTPMRLSVLPPNTGLMPLCGSTIEWKWMEAVYHKLYYRFNKDSKFLQKRLNRLYQRDFDKRFHNVRIDEIVHFTGYAPDITLYLQQSEARKVIFVHNDMYEEYKEKKNFHFNILKHAFETYDKIVAVSEATKDSIKKVGNFMDKVEVLQNAHNVDGILDKAKLPFVMEEETELSVPYEDFTRMLEGDSTKFITIGRFSPEKGHMKLMSAFNEFHKKQPNTKLIIIGGYGTLFKNTVDFSRKLECANDIYIVKSTSNPFAILKQCDLFLLPSDREPLGLVLLEADTLGVPIVATDIPGSGDFLREHQGYLVENSEKGLRKGMEEFMEGKVKPLNISFTKYNQSIVKQFEDLIGVNHTK
ncbi:MAG TPA: hypothetical protein DHW61_10690 [Lachnoclostridium phytofermentans]|uniref:Glycosyl transferase group 1 n=1 Tax=Lachnoclostridium phytofermentans TaxID=66219 RepID=A0A3D2X925_9FIRM|nr:hypothetical protein [Lachnoclostridium phytofermentans]